MRAPVESRRVIFTKLSSGFILPTLGHKESAILSHEQMTKLAVTLFARTEFLLGEVGALKIASF